MQAVERAVAKQMELRDTATGPGTVMVEVLKLLRPLGLGEEMNFAVFQ